jgi:uncharacterized membrane protein YdcZ (DUF606 family)
MLKFLARTNRLLDTIAKRLFDFRRYADYLAVSLFAALPIGAAALAGLLHDHNGFTGYLSSRNWTSLVLVLPAVIWVLRWVVLTLAPMDGSVPPIVKLFGSEEQQALAGRELKDIFLSPVNFYAAIGVMLIVQASDFAEVCGLYLHRFLDPRHLQMQDIREPDWSVMRILDSHVGPVLSNLSVTVLAYAVQFAVGVMAFFIIVLLLRHNLYFLGRIYQRRRARRNQVGPYIIIDWDHLDKHFGFGGANHAFNCEVRILAVAGLLVLASRYHNVPAQQSKTLYDAIPVLLKLLKLDFTNMDKLGAVGGTLPDVGQWILMLSWLFLLGVISIPAGVKFLPFGDRDGLDMDRTRYLKEFVPDERWPGDNNIDETSRKFAKNSFWPTGDGRALWLFGIAMTVFFVMAFPLRPIPSKIPEFLGCCGVMVALGFGIAAVGFRLLKASIAYIDNSLVETGAK